MVSASWLALVLGVCACRSDGSGQGAAAGVGGAGGTAGTGDPATLVLTVIDDSTGKPTPARVEILASDEQYYVADDALPAGGDCDMSDKGAGLVDLETTLASFSEEIWNPYRKSTQFYSSGESKIRVPAGEVNVRVFKGPEYGVSWSKVEVAAGESVALEERLKRWIDMPARSWYSSDVHLHIPRPVPDLDPLISKMMQAEDLRVANLLQMGKVRNSNIAPQHHHGAKGVYEEDGYILAAGQENPRTHFLGHTISLGTKTPIHLPERYLIYRLFWEKAARQGGINGFAHAWMHDGEMLAAHSGIALLLPHDLLNFLEVLQFNRGDYELWYEILNLGFKVAPTAGSDFPCAEQTLPGHERFYTKVEGELSYASWIEAVREGRTFVTTGPMIELKVNGQDIGSELGLEKGASVSISGSVSFDESKEFVKLVEIVMNGHVIGRVANKSDDSGRVEFELESVIEEPSWIAIRGSGYSKLESVWSEPFHFSLWKPSSNFHSAPIYVSVKGMDGTRSERSKRVAATYLARLDDLEAMLAEENMEFLANHIELPWGDDAPRETLFANRESLLAEIKAARAFFEKLTAE